MKKKENTTVKVKDIIFLGAGASASEGAPLQGNLFKEYFQICKNNKGNTDNEMQTRLINFFNTFFGVDVTNDNLANINFINFPTFEEVLGILDIAINREETFKGYSLNKGETNIKQIREDLIFLIAIILDKKLKDENSHHKQLVKRLINEGSLLHTAFISLNYDILIDNALIEVYPDYSLDYGVDFTNFEKTNDWVKPDPNQSVLLYKQHGSLNWLYCPVCVSLTLTPKEKSVAKLIFNPQNCEKCKGEMVPIIIPPTFFKVVSNYYLQQIWRKTENVLKCAERIFFCGYSFPDADIHIKYLLKRAELNRETLPNIFIINNHKGKSEKQKKNEELRYKRFFKNKKVKYTTLSFQEFCKNGIS